MNTLCVIQFVKTCAGLVSLFLLNTHAWSVSWKGHAVNPRPFGGRVAFC